MEHEKRLPNDLTSSLLTPYRHLLIFLLVFFFTPAQAVSATLHSSFNTGYEEPSRIAVDGSGILYVAAPYAGKIFKYQSNGQTAGTLAGLSRPLSVALGSNGNIYVGDTQKGEVKAISPVGAFLFSLGQGEGEFGMPGDIAVGANNHIYVTDSSSNIVKVYLHDGSFSFSFGARGSGPGQMIFPTGIAVDDEYGEVYVVDNNNGRVEVFGLDGAFKRSFGSKSAGPGQLSQPQGISVARGKVFVADAYQSRVQIYSRDGSYLSSIGTFDSTDSGGLSIPMDVLFSNYRLYVSNSGRQNIVVFDVASLFDFMRGDINGNGALGLEDAILALRIVVGLPTEGVGGDVNSDGEIGLAEALYALQCAAELRLCR